ncbi:type II toxin-antitoxin system RelE/ParE family toxin [Shewanella sp. SM101]|uniref:type II toxin-antitoxin system RelE family toxin n=1 Tax=Shewanella TaxID=22 RepID=UPI0021DAB880|nr:MULTISPECIES: type II toxin-antitoxin system RelE/ParE family toxin [unclassified Shewanella]MCU8008944.1 type II toxin-antitoxin system RelE/ParE family toxin [Shewanella sp. SM87]MCU8106895.1 type II toxin-antitoxin system RelE/ParE family toxin [Shewanella sp. SM101]
MALSVNWSSSARRQLKAIAPKFKSAILADIDLLSNKQTTGLDICRMMKAKDTYRIRVGDYRIVFVYTRTEPKAIYIEAVGSRGDVYK